MILKLSLFPTRIGIYLKTYWQTFEGSGMNVAHAYNKSKQERDLEVC